MQSEGKWNNWVQLYFYSEVEEFPLNVLIIERLHVSLILLLSISFWFFQSTFKNILHWN